MSEVEAVDGQSEKWSYYAWTDGAAVLKIRKCKISRLPIGFYILERQTAGHSSKNILVRISTYPMHGGALKFKSML